jgi:hypothetical protein
MNIAEVVAQGGAGRALAGCRDLTRTDRVYGAFWDRVRRIAGALRTARPPPGDRVALCMENRGEFFEALFACWAAGPVRGARERQAAREGGGLHRGDCRRAAAVHHRRAARRLVRLGRRRRRAEAVLCVEDDAYARHGALGPGAGPRRRSADDDAWIFYTTQRHHRAARARRSRTATCSS